MSSTHQNEQLTGFRTVDDPARSHSLLKVLMGELVLTAGGKQDGIRVTGQKCTKKSEQSGLERKEVE